MKKTLISFLLSFCVIAVSYSDENEEYEFVGVHFIASYYGCDEDILDQQESLESAIEKAVSVSGATLLKMQGYKFEPHGVTLVALLSESHASIHTYPEHRACFVDFFTCGTSCDSNRFHEVLKKELKATSCSANVISRR